MWCKAAMKAAMLPGVSVPDNHLPGSLAAAHIGFALAGVLQRVPMCIIMCLFVGVGCEVG